MDNKKRGPVTIPGKNNSSKNALRHGATAKRFINDQEKDRFEALLTSLNNHYQSNNPLIGLQLERIARVTIQLERIQNTIDALFEKSRAQTNIQKNLMDELGIDLDQQFKITTDTLILDNDRDSPENTKFKEALALRLIQPKDFVDFMKLAPTICQEIYDAAIAKEISVEDYLSEKITESNGSEARRLNALIRSLEASKTSESYKLLSLEESFLELNKIKIPRIIKWKSEEVHRINQEKTKLKDFNRLLPIAEQSTTPNLEHLDKLMRYQTTLQRQLSTTIGELIALNKQDA